jgi:hypothetical protein
MATFKSISHARKCMTIARKKMNLILDSDLETIEAKHRTPDLWFSTIGKLPEYKERSRELQTLEQDLMDTEIYLMYAKSTAMNKNLFDTCS